MFQRDKKKTLLPTAFLSTFHHLLCKPKILENSTNKHLRPWVRYLLILLERLNFCLLLVVACHDIKSPYMCGLLFLKEIGCYMMTLSHSLFLFSIAHSHYVNSSKILGIRNYNKKVNPLSFNDQAGGSVHILLSTPKKKIFQRGHVLKNVDLSLFVRNP